MLSLTGNTFDPDKDIPDLTGKVRLEPLAPYHILYQCEPISSQPLLGDRITS
jgi:hypothetical protein